MRSPSPQTTSLTVSDDEVVATDVPPRCYQPRFPPLYLRPNGDEPRGDGADGRPDGMPNDVEQNFAFGAVEDFDEIADAFFPDVERVLTRRPGHDVFPVAAEATLFPQGFVHEILEFLHGFRLALFATRQHLLRFEYTNDSVRRIHQKTAGGVGMGEEGGGGDFFRVGVKKKGALLNNY